MSLVRTTRPPPPKGPTVSEPLLYANKRSTMSAAEKTMNLIYFMWR